MTGRASAAARCIEFIGSVGLDIEVQAGATGFTEGVDIRDGTLYVDPDVAAPSNLLHEAGHLATVPGEYRHLFQSNVEGGQRRMLEALDEAGAEPDSPLYRAALQCSDPEATAWAWAAGTHLGIPEEEIILDGEYGGEGDIVRLQLRNRAYIGINGLAAAGFCSTGVMQAKVNGRPAFPKMKMWIQPFDLAPSS